MKQEIPKIPETRIVAVAKAERKAQEEWDLWKTACRASVPKPGDIYPEMYVMKPGSYSGEFLLRLTETDVIYVKVEDEGTEVIKAGVTDENHEITEEAQLADNQTVRIMNVDTEEIKAAYRSYGNGQIKGIAYAINEAISYYHEDGRVEHYRNFAMREIHEILES